MFRRIFLRRFFSPSFRPALRPRLISSAPANAQPIPQTRTASSWSKIVDAVKGKDLPTKRVDNVEISKGAVEGAREAEVLAAFQVGATGGQGSSSGNAGGSSSRSAPFPTPSASSPRKKDRRRNRRNRSVTAQPGSLSHQDGHLRRLSAPQFKVAGRTGALFYRVDQLPPTVTDRGPEGIWGKAKKKLPNSSNQSPLTSIDPAQTPTSGAVVPATDPIQVSALSSTSSPSSALSTSELAVESTNEAYHLKPSKKPQLVSEDRTSWDDSVELEPKFSRSAPSSPSSIRVKSATATPKATRSNAKSVSYSRGKSLAAEGESSGEKVQAVPKEPSPVTVASSPSAPPPVKPSSSITLNPRVLQQWENLRKQESWMHPQSNYPYSYMVNPSTGFNHFFRSSQSPISRRAQLHASHLHKIDWIRSYRTKQDALLPPTQNVLQERLHIDTKLERARQLDDRLLTAKEAWIKEQQLTHKVQDLNGLVDTLKKFRDDSFRWHRILERDATHEAILRNKIDTLVAEETRIRSQPSTFPPPTVQPAHWSFANSPVKALRFADRDRTKTYDVLFSELNKSQPQGPSVRDLSQLENAIVRRQREVASLFNEISGHGWRSLE